MKRLLAATAALSALALAAPAHADPQRYEDGRAYQQNYDPGRAGPSYGPNNYGSNNYGQGDFRGGGEHRFSRDDLYRLQRRIDWGARSGALTRWEARDLYAQLGDLQNRARFYWRTDGASWRERQDLQARYERLSFQVNRQCHDNDYRGDGHRDNDYLA